MKNMGTVISCIRPSHPTHNLGNNGGGADSTALGSLIFFQQLYNTNILGLTANWQT